MSPAPVIAIVEDDEAVRVALSELLMALDFDPRAFDSASAFLREMEVERFDGLITDIRMPGMSGLDLLERLREAGSDLPVLVVTSSTEDAVRQRSLALGASAFLVKPVSEERLVQELTNALGLRRPGRADG